MGAGGTTVAVVQLLPLDVHSMVRNRLDCSICCLKVWKTGVRLLHRRVVPPTGVFKFFKSPRELGCDECSHNDAVAHFPSPTQVRG